MFDVGALYRIHWRGLRKCCSQNDAASCGTPSWPHFGKVDTGYRSPLLDSSTDPSESVYSSFFLPQGSASGFPLNKTSLFLTTRVPRADIVFATLALFESIDSARCYSLHRVYSGEYILNRHYRFPWTRTETQHRHGVEWNSCPPSKPRHSLLPRDHHLAYFLEFGNLTYESSSGLLKDGISGGINP